MPNRFKSTTLVLVEQPSVPTDFVKPVDTTDINERLASMQQQILSRTRLEPLIHQYGLFQSDMNKVSMDDLVGRLQKAIEVTPVLPMAETRASNLPGFFVNVTLDDARTAQEVCTTVTSMFIEENLRRRQAQSEDTTQFLSQQLTEAKAKLDEQDAKLAAFKSHYIGALPGRRADQFESSDRADLAARCRQPGPGARAAGQDLRAIHADAADCGVGSFQDRAEPGNDGSATGGSSNATGQPSRRATPTTIPM